MPKIFNKPLLIFLAFIAAITCATQAKAQESIREQEINQCHANEIATWGDGQDRLAISSPLVFSYNPTDAPAWFAKAQVSGLVIKAAQAWSKCGVETRLLDWSPGMASAPGIIVVQWSVKGSRGNFGLADLGSRTLSLGPQAFEALRKANPAHDATQTLQLVISHEMGHFYGLMAHSRRCVDVLSYYDNGKGEKCYTRGSMPLKGVPEYRHLLPTACDIERCRRVNGK